MRGVAALMVLVLVSPAVAQPVPGRFWDREAKLVLAQSLVGEADFRPRDHAAIAWVLAKRFKMCLRNRHPRPVCQDFSTLVRAYSAPMRVSGDRSDAVRALPWGPPLPGRYKKYRARWARLRRWVLNWGRGKITDPCPNAIHWGGPMDPKPKGWRVVDCGSTENIFYQSRR